MKNVFEEQPFEYQFKKSDLEAAHRDFKNRSAHHSLPEHAGKCFK